MLPQECAPGKARPVAKAQRPAADLKAEIHPGKKESGYKQGIGKMQELAPQGAQKIIDKT